MGTLGIRYIGDTYWLASRRVTSSSSLTQFILRAVESDGLSDGRLCHVSIDSGLIADGGGCGLRPVFHLKSNVKVTGGTGDEGSPYTLGT